MKRTLLFSLAVVSLVGAGCFSKQNIATKKTTNTVVTQPTPQPYLPPPKVVPSDEQNLAIVKAAIQRFNDSKTFRASISTSGPTGLTTGQISVMKPDRFKGTIQLPNQTQPSNIIAIGSTLYVQVPNATWVVFDQPAVSAALRQAFNAGLNGSGSLKDDRFPAGTVFTKTANPRGDCARYSTTLLEEEKNLAISICVRNGFPVHMDTAYEQTTISIDYTDFNSLFTIERPNIPKDRL